MNFSILKRLKITFTIPFNDTIVVLLSAVGRCTAGFLKHNMEDPKTVERLMVKMYENQKIVVEDKQSHSHLQTI
uniref:Uncharacterized protein n=1 Tax=Amphiprion percula TaxID=161767 RepID=A0A3P8SV61_AMPPE